MASFSEWCPIFPIVKETVMKGHLSCRDTISGDIEQVSLYIERQVSHQDGIRWIEQSLI